MKNVADLYALSPMQQLMLVHALSGRDRGAMCEQLTCTLAGPLDVAAFRRAWETVVARHPALRTCFVSEGVKKPLQVVREQVTLPWTDLDWSALAADERRARRAALVAEDRRQGFDLRKAPLLRTHLARLGDDRWFFMWTCCHLALDGWCLGLVLGEVFSCYEQLRAGRAAQLPPVRPFRDYIAWLAKQSPERARAFWRERLHGLAPQPRLPSELPRVEQLRRIPGEGQCERALSTVDTERLRALAAEQRVSLNALVQAAWAIWLARATESDEVVFGVTVSGRPPEITSVESIVGPFINNLPLRISVRGDEPVRALAARLHALQADMQPFEHCTLDDISAAAELPRGSRLFQTLVVFENYPVEEAGRRRVGPLELQDVHGTASSAYPMSLVAFPGSALRLRMLFDARRLDEQSAAHAIEQTAALLEAIAARPDARVSDLAMTESSRACDGEESIRDLHGQPAGAGVPGQLWTSRGGVARATGSRGVVRDDGSIEYLGPSAVPLRIAGRGAAPAEIEAVLRLHPLVADVAVVGRADGQGDLQLAAYVAPRGKASLGIESGQHGLLLGQLRGFAEERLPAPLVPSAWRAVESLLRDEAGNVDPHALPEAVRPRGELAQEYAAPRDALEERLAALWSETLCVAPIGVDDSFLDLGGYSSLAVALLSRMEEEFGRKLPLASLFAQPTIARMAEALRRAPGSPEEISLVPIRASGDAAPLFCVHPAGGTVFCYVELANRLPETVPVYGLQAQGIDGALAPHESVAEMAAHYIRAMKSVQSAGPYRVCGWSSGGIVAFEVARQLAAADDVVSLVALFDSGVPRPGESFGAEDLAPMLGLMFPGEDPLHLKQLLELPPEQQLEYFRQRAQDAQLVMAGAGALAAQRIYEVFQANMRAVIDYRPQPYPGRLTLFRAAEHVTPMHADPHLGWRPWAAEFDIAEVPGSHMTMFQDPTVGQLAEELAARLAAAAAPQHAPRPHQVSPRDRASTAPR